MDPQKSLRGFRGVIDKYFRFSIIEPPAWKLEGMFRSSNKVPFTKILRKRTPKGVGIDNARSHTTHLVEDLVVSETIKRIERAACLPNPVCLEHTQDQSLLFLSKTWRSLFVTQEWNSNLQSVTDNLIGSMLNSAAVLAVL
ncbi:hypothetical protein TNCV_4393701 [Trichonephila clavipes]|nr:hypothetical protein TNCV_4393701 [Trichonephila clavipes]